MNQILRGVAYGIGFILLAFIAVLVYMHFQGNPISAATATPTASSTDWYDQQLAAISPTCAAYYEDSGNGTDTMDVELADFTHLHPLSDFLCGSYTLQQPKVQLADGKTLYFVAPVSAVDCGGDGHCLYYPLLEEQPGLVRHLRGFTWHDDAGSTSTISVSQDTDGTLNAIWELSWVPPNSIAVYEEQDHSNACGTTNTYTFDKNDNPVLVSASDSCLPGKGILYPTK